MAGFMTFVAVITWLGGLLTAILAGVWDESWGLFFGIAFAAAVEGSMFMAVAILLRNQSTMRDNQKKLQQRLEELSGRIDGLSGRTAAPVEETTEPDVKSSVTLGKPAAPVSPTVVEAEHTESSEGRKGLRCLLCGRMQPNTLRRCCAYCAAPFAETEDQT